MKLSWLSSERSSKDLPIVSGIRAVLAIPVAMKRAKISKIWGKNALEPVLPPMSIILANPTWATMAPSLPEAAEMPWKVDR